MGILSRLGFGPNQFAIEQAQNNTIGISTPWGSNGSLTQIVASDVFGQELVDLMPLTRDAAITIPAVSKARNLLVSAIAKNPLVALNADGPLADKDQPTFLYRTNGQVSPYERMVWTVDSLIFWGVALWLVERGADGAILDASWVRQKDWKITNGQILVDDVPVDAADVILFNSSFEGLLNVAGRTLRGAIDTENAWTGRMRNPIPLVELRVTDDTNLEQEEIDAYVQAWGKARRQIDGAVGATPMGMELVDHGSVDPALFLEGRNAIRTDVGSFLNVRASMLDGTSSIDSLTYVTKDGERNAFFDLDLPFWTDAIVHRLSQDDVVPRGQRVRFDFSEQYTTTPTPTGAPEQD